MPLKLQLVGKIALNIVVLPRPWEVDHVRNWLADLCAGCQRPSRQQEEFAADPTSKTLAVLPIAGDVLDCQGVAEVPVRRVDDLPLSRLVVGAGQEVFDVIGTKSLGSFTGNLSARQGCDERSTSSQGRRWVSPIVAPADFEHQ